MAEIRTSTRPARKIPHRKGRAVRKGAAAMFDVTVTVTKTFLPHVPGQKAVLMRIGAMGGAMIRKRILGPNVDASGQKLPKLKKLKAPDVHVGGVRVDGREYDKRSNAIIWAVRQKRSTHYSVGDDVSLTRRGGGKVTGTVVVTTRDNYGRRKLRAGAKNRRDGWMTGSMWRSLGATVQDKGVGKKRVRVFFRGGDKSQRSGRKMLKSGKMSKGRAMKQNDKAYFLQTKAPRPFELMGFTAKELDTLRDFYISKLRLFKSGG